MSAHVLNSTWGQKALLVTKGFSLNEEGLLVSGKRCEAT